MPATIHPPHIHAPSDRDDLTFCREPRLWKPVSSDWDDVTCPACVERHLKPSRMASYIHAVGLNGLTACGIDQTWQLRSPEWANVTCPECINPPAPESAGRPAVIGLHYSPKGGGHVPICGAESIGSQGTLTASDWELVTCEDCRHRAGAIAEETAGRPAEREIPMTFEEWNEAGPQEEPVTENGDVQERTYDRFRHAWNMTNGPRHEHDCGECIYLGTLNHHDVDLYFHGAGQSTVIARRGAEGNYESGLDFIDRDMFLALAYVRAQKAGLL